ncbi:hypothetical protein TorRG33x02_216870 [Trema orientale]|uniref:Uncharacterized protein n=1 Tax=Trema orientale TaxID=63057 RepID=A0A2P5EAF8_TREOI|nr:hypothetical protein TorRG33x02_216870 [Trema orientale]
MMQAANCSDKIRGRPITLRRLALHHSQTSSSRGRKRAVALTSLTSQRTTTRDLPPRPPHKRNHSEHRREVTHTRVARSMFKRVRRSADDLDCEHGSDLCDCLKQ